MLFMARYRPKAGFSSADQAKTLEIWSRWTPPDGFDIQSFLLDAAGNGGFVLVEADSAATVYEAMAPWATVYLDYDITPVVPLEAGLPLLQKSMEFRGG